MHIPEHVCPKCINPMTYTGGDIRETNDEIIRFGDYHCERCNKDFQLIRRFKEVSRTLVELK